MKHFSAITLLAVVLWIGIPCMAADQFTTDAFTSDIHALATMDGRSTGSFGCGSAAAYIRKQFEATGFSEVGAERFSTPIREQGDCRLTIPGRQTQCPLRQILANAISPQATAPEGLKGPLVYAGNGDLSRLNGKPIEGAILLMELDSGKNWIQAANLGAKALIYIDRGQSSRYLFEDKEELTPINFPRFWISLDDARKYFGDFESAQNGVIASEAVLNATAVWKEADSDNVYCLIPGTHPKLQDDLVMIEAFYDSTDYVAGHSPGADEACGAATLLELARKFKQNPPERSVLLVATSGHAQTLAGLRDIMWSLKSSPKNLRKEKKHLRDLIRDTRKVIASLSQTSEDKKHPAETDSTETPDYQEPGSLETLVKKAISDEIKTQVDHISRELMQLRLSQTNADSQNRIQELAEQRLFLRKLDWQPSFDHLDAEDAQALARLKPLALNRQKAILKDAIHEARLLDSALHFRSMVKNRELTVTVSLHLSSHGDGFGAFNHGWLYNLKPTADHFSAFATLDDAMRKDKTALNLDLFRDTLRPSRQTPWQDYFMDRPELGGEVSTLAGYVGITLATVHDARNFWGTPYDTPENIDWNYAALQNHQVCALLSHIVNAPQIYNDNLPQNGFSTVTGRANFIRQGELFADQPASDTVILSYQGAGRYHAIVDHLGVFQLKGVADKRHVLDKVIIEGYRFDPISGKPVWSIDKEQTGKNAYRLKMQRTAMETDLVMFACSTTTLFDLLDPRGFRYMTKISLIDGRMEALPLHYWFSRIDTRSSVLASIFLEPGTRLKLTLSDSVIHKKMILTHALPDHANGSGYLIDDWPMIYHTEYHTAQDMWALLGPRIAALEEHGIFNEQVRKLQKDGNKALDTAAQALKARDYARFLESSSASWALASRVYDDVEQTQKDVLFGVLFYIALFVPFAFCMERLLFSFSDIYKRIIAFIGILLAVIVIIYHVHPAFQLAYSPVVVILAFFIIGLSFIVTLIVFLRFEEEMNRLQHRAKLDETGDIGRWKAFSASFFLGVSNLRRRRIRTALTCATLIILTFTIMSFTSVKSMRLHSRILYQPSAPYSGFLLKNVNWQDIPQEALPVLSNAFDDSGPIAPRVWFENTDRTRTRDVPLRYHNKKFIAQGMVGLSPREPEVTGLNRILIAGQWFGPKDRRSVIISDRMAQELGIGITTGSLPDILIWGVPWRVAGIFSGKRLQNAPDLDGEPLTPVTFPREAAQELTEVEMDAMESGDDVRTFQSRYQHTPEELTVIVPSETLLSLGGKLKAIAVRHATDSHTLRIAAQHLVDRLGLAVFSGEKNGTYLYSASDAISYSGVPNIVIPIIISICIVLNTMIGSVYERKREIAIYTSVGLAPSHVSFLFIAEAMAFAVLSVVMGYLFAQTSARLFAGTSLWAGVTVNYSSLSGVAAMILVILVVLISVIYPSRVAAEIAIPDVNRAWTLPPSQGNQLEITLPFLMKYHEHKSIAGFLFDYFKSHQDVSHGLFATDDITLNEVCPVTQAIHPAEACSGTACCRDSCVQIYTHVWLTPFDFGIMQKATLRFCQSSEEPGFLEIKILLERESGESNAWRRINKVFLHTIRRQLLMWRSLNSEEQEYYEKLLLNALDSAAQTP